MKCPQKVGHKTFGGISLLDSSFFIVFQRDCEGLKQRGLDRFPSPYSLRLFLDVSYRRWSVESNE